jgi:hypothetical protein
MSFPQTIFEIQIENCVSIRLQITFSYQLKFPMLIFTIRKVEVLKLFFVVMEYETILGADC